MTAALEITPQWEELAQGSPEDRASFCLLGIRWGDTWLTQAEDAFVSSLRERVPLSAYRLAEWLVWNWHRLRWEPRTDASDWGRAHRMSTIGGGYVWPNITIFSDGERVVWLARPTAKVAAEPLRYTCSLAAVVRAKTFETAVDDYVEQVLGRLELREVRSSNLKTLWTDLATERRDEDARRRRRLEALLGFDPDESNLAVIEGLVADSSALGEMAVNELAANRSASGEVTTAADVRALAMSRGVQHNVADIVILRSKADLPAVGQAPAWQRGAEAAKRLREQERLGDGPIDNAVLAAMFGIQTSALASAVENQEVSFALDEAAVGRVVLRPKRESGRRFELARLIGDRVTAMGVEQLWPATRAYTYRQKLQRSFAAELLCPLDALDDFLGGDFTVEAIEDAASHFNVSDWTVRTLLMNNHRIPRTDLDSDFDTAA